MSVFDESPELSKTWKRFAKVLNKIDALEDLKHITTNLTRVEMKWLFLRYEATSARLWELICQHPLPDDVKKQFISAVTADLSRPTINYITIHLAEPSQFTRREFDAWFSVRAHSAGNLLEENSSCEVLHPELISLAEKLWSTNPKVAIENLYNNQDVSSRPSADSLLEKYALESWAEHKWAREALHTAERGLETLELSLRLSDFVRWTCSDRKFPNHRFDAEFSPPSLFADSNQFGARLTGQAGFNKIGLLPVWETSNGEFISPLWEYLAWSAYSGESSDEIYDCLSRIGRGIDAQTVLNSPGHKDYCTDRLNVHLDSIFRAGQAETRLRVKLELEDVAKSGLAIISGRKKGSGKGGQKNAQKFQLLKVGILSYIPTALSQVGAAFIWQTNARQAAKLRELALADRPDDFVGTSGAPLSAKWFSDALEDFKAGEEFREAIQAHMSGLSEK